MSEVKMNSTAKKFENTNSSVIWHKVLTEAKKHCEHFTKPDLPANVEKMIEVAQDFDAKPDFHLDYDSSKVKIAGLDDEYRACAQPRKRAYLKSNASDLLEKIKTDGELHNPIFVAIWRDNFGVPINNHRWEGMEIIKSDEEICDQFNLKVITLDVSHLSKKDFKDFLIKISDFSNFLPESLPAPTDRESHINMVKRWRMATCSMMIRPKNVFGTTRLTLPKQR